MNWIRIKEQTPKHGQIIIPYRSDMHWDTWVVTLTLPLLIWDDEKQKAKDSKWEFTITHWLPAPEEPKEEKKYPCQGSLNHSSWICMHKICNECTPNGCKCYEGF